MFYILFYSVPKIQLLPVFFTIYLNLNELDVFLSNIVVQCEMDSFILYTQLSF